MDLHLEMTEAARPASRAVQSKNMWKESEIRPKLDTNTQQQTCKDGEHGEENLLMQESNTSMNRKTADDPSGLNTKVC